MKDIDFFRKNLIAMALVGGVALAGCADADDGMDDEGIAEEMEEVGQDIETQTQELGQRMTAPFAQLDRDTNDQISEQEFRAYAEQQGLFQRWDADRNQQVGQNEFNAIGFEQGIGDFEAWDENDDGNLTQDEFWGGLYGAFDDNEDGHWDGDEWDDAGEAGFWDF